MDTSCFKACDIRSKVPEQLNEELAYKIGCAFVAELETSSVSERMQAYPCSGEINYTVDDVPKVLDKVTAHFASENPVLDKTDGVSLEFDNWRMNIRASNTEPLLRLNVETRADSKLLWQKVKEIEDLID